MRRVKHIIRAALAMTLVVGTMLLAWPQNARAASDPSLIISQLKITSSNGQFVTLYNPTNSVLDMSKFQLQYFNNYDLTKSTSSRLIALSGSLSPHSYYTISDDDLIMCYKMIVDSNSLGFSSTAGMIQVVQLTQNSSGGSVAPSIVDFASWTKTAASGAQTLPSSTSAWLQRRPLDATGSPLISAPGAGGWVAVQQDVNNSCNIVTVNLQNSNLLTESSLLPATQPPVTFLNINIAQTSATTLSDSNLPESDRGLMTPIINELLPNPLGTGNDSTDEFIELYNPNSTPFDLSGFSLQTGLTSFHNYKFASGEVLAPLSFTAYYSVKTGLSLSNSGGQARLFDPGGIVINQTAEYSDAKEGQSWAYANAKWYWTSDITPGLANIIRTNMNKSSSTKPTSSKSSKLKTITKTKLKKSSKKAKPKKPKPKKSTIVQTASLQNTAQKTTVNKQFLAVVIAGAVIYVAYEYRLEITNRYRKFRSNRAVR